MFKSVLPEKWYLEWLRKKGFTKKTKVVGVFSDFHNE